MPMFDKLNNEIKKQNIKEQSKAIFLNNKERKLFEQELIFGNLLEDLASLDIENGYTALAEEDIQPAIDGEAVATPDIEDIQDKKR